MKKFAIEEEIKWNFHGLPHSSALYCFQGNFQRMPHSSTTNISAVLVHKKRPSLHIAAIWTLQMSNTQQRFELSLAETFSFYKIKRFVLYLFDKAHLKRLYCFPCLLSNFVTIFLNSISLCFLHKKPLYTAI